MTIRTAFSFGVEIAGNDRLILLHKVSLIMPLPQSYQGRLQALDGVQLATHQTWFGGVYQDPSNFFAQIVVEPEAHLAMYPEFTLSPEQRAAWLADRQGAIVGRDLADRFGWRIGDRIPIQATIWQPKQGTTWEFNIVGIYDGGDGVDKSTDVLPIRLPRREPGPGRTGVVGWYIVQHLRPGAGRSNLAADLRRNVRELPGRDQDDDREGLHRGLRQPGREHRRDHGRDRHRGALQHPADCGHHHGAGRARA